MRNALLFASLFTFIFGFIYWKIQKQLTKPPPTNQEIRQSPEYQQWRRAVLKRDEYRCVWCKATDNLEAHHIYSFASFPELRFDIKNGLTLCHDCHKLTPNHGYKEKAFSQQIINSK